MDSRVALPNEAVEWPPILDTITRNPPTSLDGPDKIFLTSLPIMHLPAALSRIRLLALLAQFSCVSGAFGQSATALHARAMSLYNAGDLTGAVREMHRAVALDAS